MGDNPPATVIPFVDGGNGQRLASTYTTTVTPATTPLIVSFTSVVHQPNINAVELHTIENKSGSPDTPAATTAMNDDGPVTIGPVFNEGEFEGCDSPSPFDCIDDDVADNTLPPLRRAPVVVSLPYLNYRFIEADGFSLKPFAILAEQDTQITQIVIEYTNGTTGPIDPPPVVVFPPGGQRV